MPRTDADPKATPEIVVVFWRDIPAQVIVGAGRRAAKAALPERFEKAIDRAAMRAGATDDAYLAEWRKAAIGPAEGDPAEAARAAAARLEAEYDDARLLALVGNHGRA